MTPARMATMTAPASAVTASQITRACSGVGGGKFMIGRWKLEVERERKITDADALTRIFHTLSAGSGDPAYRDWPGGVVGRVPSRGGAPIQSVCEIPGLRRPPLSIL